MAASLLQDMDMEQLQEHIIRQREPHIQSLESIHARCQRARQKWIEAEADEIMQARRFMCSAIFDARKKKLQNMHPALDTIERSIGLSNNAEFDKTTAIELAAAMGSLVDILIKLGGLEAITMETFMGSDADPLTASRREAIHQQLEPYERYVGVEPIGRQVDVVRRLMSKTDDVWNDESKLLPSRSMLLVLIKAVFELVTLVSWRFDIRRSVTLSVAQRDPSTQQFIGGIIQKRRSEPLRSQPREEM